MPTTQQRPNLAATRPAGTSAAVVLIRDGKVLLQRHPKTDPVYASMWDLPVLAVPAGEAPEDVLLAQAETAFGITIREFHLLGARDDLAGGACWRRFVYRVTGFQGEPHHPEAQRWYGRREFADVFQLNPLVQALQIFED